MKPFRPPATLSHRQPRLLGNIATELYRAARSLSRRPRFTLPAVSTLALGMAVSTNLFALAEKLQAFTMPRNRPNSRVRDLPDLALLAKTGPIEGAESATRLRGGRVDPEAPPATSASTRSEMVDQLTQSSNTPRNSNTLYAWLREVAAMREAA